MASEIDDGSKQVPTGTACSQDTDFRIDGSFRKESVRMTETGAMGYGRAVAQNGAPVMRKRELEDAIESDFRGFEPPQGIAKGTDDLFDHRLDVPIVSMCVPAISNGRPGVIVRRHHHDI
jgi:hypothetical protein